ncbi:MAG TPA: hypothetical protein VLG10_03410 [Methylomirabilota bacterium]|nr:hypothetical protein [Methylomirabilota bacterium]
MSLRIAVVALALLVGVPVFAQDRPADTMQLVREKVRADKKLLVAQNMGLSEAEAKGFWPVYEGYQQELDKIYTRMGKVITDYAKAYNADTLTDEQARKLSAEVLDIDASEVSLAKSYAGRLEKVLPSKKVARYLQIERKIRAVLRYELADGIPLVK